MSSNPIAESGPCVYEFDRTEEGPQEPWRQQGLWGAHGDRGCTAEGSSTTDTLKNDLEIKSLLPSQAAFKSSPGDFGHLYFQIVMQRNRINLKSLIFLFLQVKKISVFFKTYQLFIIIASSLISRPGNIPV